MAKATSNVIIIQPGSRNLYIGRASDLQPVRVLHVIARKHKKTPNQANSSSASSIHAHKDNIGPLNEKRLTEKVPQEVESARLQLSLTLKSARMNSSEEIDEQNPKVLTDLKILTELNRNAKRTPISTTPVTAPKISKEFERKAFIVGDEVLKLSPGAAYNIHCPWRRGQLNLHRGVGGSITSVMTDLEDIWLWCLKSKLGVLRKDLNTYKAVVVVPAMFDRVHAKQIMSLLINRLGFQFAFLIQDHVCATFGCGISCATVVDVGDQKISVSCVDDGVSYPQSRIELKYGGGDLTVALWNQLRLTGFPIPIDISQQWDLEFLNTLKEKYCHLNVNEMDGGPKEETILWDKPGQIPTEYCVHFGDELLLVPLSYFNPDLLRGSIGRKAIICHVPQPTVHDDPLDRIYLTETSKRKDCDEGEEDDPAIGPHDDPRETTSEKKNFDLPLGIEQAIVQSIESCNIPDDLKRRLYLCIIVVGGGYKIKRLTDWLRDRMKTVTPKHFVTDVADEPKIVTSAKNKGETCTTTWKGAAILSSLETAKELWISEAEWRKFGSKILREKSLFQF